jgi:hypothetical protein
MHKYIRKLRRVVSISAPSSNNYLEIGKIKKNAS